MLQGCTRLSPIDNARCTLYITVGSTVFHLHHIHFAIDWISFCDQMWKFTTKVTETWLFGRNFRSPFAITKSKNQRTAATTSKLTTIVTIATDDQTCFSACLFCTVKVSISSSTSRNKLCRRFLTSSDNAIYLALYSESKEKGQAKKLNVSVHLRDKISYWNKRLIYQTSIRNLGRDGVPCAKKKVAKPKDA